MIYQGITPDCLPTTAVLVAITFIEKDRKEKSGGGRRTHCQSVRDRERGHNLVFPMAEQERVEMHDEHTHTLATPVILGTLADHTQFAQPVISDSTPQAEEEVRGSLPPNDPCDDP